MNRFPGGGRATPWDLALLPGGGRLRGVGAGRYIEHTRLYPTTVVRIIECGTSKQRRKEEDEARVVQNGGQLAESPILLMVIEFILGLLAIPHIPAKGRQLHHHDHLYTSDVHGTRVICHLTVDMVERHVTHEEYEANPWHIRTLDVFGNGIGADGANQDRANAIP